MKNNIFKRVINRNFAMQERFKNHVEKIANQQENKRDFMPLFFNLEMKMLSEKERKSCLFNVTKKYFDIKQKTQENKKVI